MKSRIIVGMDINDPDISYEILDNPRKYIERGHYDVRILGFYPYEEFEDDIGGERGSLVAMYEYDGWNIPINTLVEALEVYGTVMGLLWCSDGVKGVTVDEESSEEYSKEFSEESSKWFVPLNLHCDFYLPINLHEECAGFYCLDPCPGHYSVSDEWVEYCVQSKYKARIYEELWVKESPSITNSIEGLPPKWRDLQYLIYNIRGDL